jgi:ATP-dependent Lon protease
VATQRIPLFPLEVVLLPGMSLPLHIFESRYKLMTRRCLRTHEPFGIVLIRGEEITRVGCTAAIQRLVRQFNDGRMDILTAGLRRYRIAELFHEQPYLEAAIEFLEESGAPAPASSPQLLELFAHCHRLVFGRAPETTEAAPGGSLAFLIASVLPLDLEARQELLELDSEAQRQTLLLVLLQAQLPEFARRERTRQSARGNGHGAK